MYISLDASDICHLLIYQSFFRNALAQRALALEGATEHRASFNFMRQLVGRVRSFSKVLVFV